MGKTNKNKRKRRPIKTIKRKKRHKGGIGTVGAVGAVVDAVDEESERIQLEEHATANAERNYQLNSMLSNPTIRMRNTLDLVCKKSGDCIALGSVYNSMIFEFFDQFNNMALINKRNVKMLANGNNGKVVELQFQKDNYTAYAILKCSMKQTADNLSYEYYVGKYVINALLNIFPCFIETYGLYNNTLLFSNRHFLKNLKKITNFNWEDSCKYVKTRYILAQHFDNFVSLAHTEKSKKEYDIGNIMYQVYYPLCLLGSTYTHYDLHSNNVQLYKPFKGDVYVQMHYHINDTTVLSFPSEWIVKIIDYGRNYFRTKTTDSHAVLTEICAASACKPNCGTHVGYNAIRGSIERIDVNNADLAGKYYIDPSKPNTSHDLLLANYDKNWFNTALNIHIVYNAQFGTPQSPNLASPDINPDIIQLNTPINVATVSDIEVALRYKLPFWNADKMPMKYGNWTKGADLHVYYDERNYTFVPV